MRLLYDYNTIFLTGEVKDHILSHAIIECSDTDQKEEFA